MRTFFLKLGLTAAAVASSVAVVSPASAAPARDASAAFGGHVGTSACLSAPTSPRNRDSTVGSVRSGKVGTIRRGPYAECDPLGVAYPGARLDYWCYVYNEYGLGWTFVEATTVGIRGWVYDDNLTGQGSDLPC